MATARIKPGPPVFVLKISREEAETIRWHFAHTEAHGRPMGPLTTAIDEALAIAGVEVMEF